MLAYSSVNPWSAFAPVIFFLIALGLFMGTIYLVSVTRQKERDRRKAEEERRRREQDRIEQHRAAIAAERARQIQRRQNAQQAFRAWQDETRRIME